MYEHCAQNMRVSYFRCPVLHQVKLTKESVKHFRLYVQLASDDGDIQNIIDAITELEKRIPMYEKLQRAERVADVLWGPGSDSLLKRLKMFTFNAIQIRVNPC